MIKQAYFRGLMKVAAQPPAWQMQQQQDRALVNGTGITGNKLQYHGFYKGTPVANLKQKSNDVLQPNDYRASQANLSTNKFAPHWQDPVSHRLYMYYKDIGRQNRDFYLKNGYRPPANHQYKTPFPYPNHPKKKQMMQQNQHQVNNTRIPQAGFQLPRNINWQQLYRGVAAPV